MENEMLIHVQTTVENGTPIQGHKLDAINWKLIALASPRFCKHSPKYVDL
jgi:hypothetical protein